MKKLIVIPMLCFSLLILGQNQYDETLYPNNMATGVYYQTGPGSNNALGWAHPYGTKLTVMGAAHRNFELITTSYPYGSLKLRQWNTTDNLWTNWRTILIQDENGKFVVDQELFIKGINPRGSAFLNIARGSDGKDRAVVSYLNDQESKWHTGLLYGGGSLTPDFHISQKDEFRDGNGNIVHEPEFTIKTNGDVGVGTRTPNAKLAVNGNIHAKEVKVDLVGWPDYVFNDNYDLPTLDEVENYIKAKGHLINIPSAEEVAKNGVQLGEMNKLLLEKIEELTLYIIDQDKTIAHLKDQNKILRSLQHDIELIKQKLKNNEEH